jgi:hypothetical protein
MPTVAMLFICFALGLALGGWWGWMLGADNARRRGEGG